MKPIVRRVSVLILFVTIIAGVSRADSGTPAEQYAALLKAYNPVSGGMRKAATDQERKAAVELLGTYSVKFVELAEKYRDDPVALQALQQAVQAAGSTDSAAQIAWDTNRTDFPTGSTDGAAGKIVEALVRDHVLSDKLDPVIDRMRYGYRMEFEGFLRMVVQKNPHRDVQAAACLALAQFLNDKLRVLQLAEERTDLTLRFEILFGKTYLPDLQRRDQVELAEVIEGLFEQAAKYEDVKHRAGGSIAEQAKLELYDIRNLAVGKAAPETAGIDQDGQEFKLSDYRGKVVLLYFWSEY